MKTLFCCAALLSALLVSALAVQAKPKKPAPRPAPAKAIKMPAAPAVIAVGDVAVPAAKPADAPAVDTDTSTTANLAFVGGTPFLRIHTSWGGLSPEERMNQVQDRINAAFAIGPIYPSDITTGKLSGDWVVLLRGKRFFTADPGSAAYHHSTPQTLAEEWAKNMRQVLPDLTRQTEITPAKPADTSAVSPAPPAPAPAQ